MHEYVYACIHACMHLYMLTDIKKITCIRTLIYYYIQTVHACILRSHILIS